MTAAKTRVVLASAVCGLLVVLASPALGADGTNIDHVDVAPGGQVSVVLSVDGLPDGASPDLSSLEVAIDGEAVDATAEPLQAGDVERLTVLALDASRSMRGERFTAAKAAARGFLDAAPSDVHIGMLTFAGELADETPPTTDHAALEATIDGIELSRGTRLHDAVIRAVEMAGDAGARSVLVVSDGEDVGSSATLQEASDAATEAGVVVDVVAIEQSGAARAKLETIANATGGRVINARRVEALEQVVADQADALASQVLVRFAQPEGSATEASVSIGLTAGDVTYTDSAFIALVPKTGPQEPTVVAPKPALLGDTGLMAGGVILGLGLAGIMAVVLVGSRSAGATLQQQMSYYSATGAVPQDASRVRSNPTPGLKQTAVSAAEKFVKGDFETRVAQRLNGAGLTLTAAEWLLLHAGVAITAGLVGLVLRGPALMVVMLLVGGVLPWVYLKRKHSRRLATFNSQLAETLQLMAGGLSAGLSLPQAVDTVVREGQEPVAGELRRALVEQRLGLEIEEALEGIAGRMESQDFSWVVMAIRIQREVGGNLAELLNTVADTLRERDYLRRQVRVLTAEGRLSAWVLGGLPIAMFVYMLFARPGFVRPLYTEFLGLVMSAVAIVLLVSGFFVMSKLVKVEV